MVSIINKNMLFKKQQCLQRLSQRTNCSKTQTKTIFYSHNKAFLRLSSILKNLFKIYRFKCLTRYYKSFSRWRCQAAVIKQFSSCKREVEGNYEKQLGSSKTKAENKLRDKDRVIGQQKTDIEVMNQRKNEIVDKIKQYEAAASKQTEAVQSLEKEITELKVEKTQVTDGVNENGNTKEHLESYLKELELTAKSLIEQNKEKDSQLNIYIREMNEMLEVFEKKSGNSITMIIISI